MYEYSEEIADVAPKLLGPMCKSADTEGTLVNQTALTKLLCDLFNFILQFDDRKMINPNVQNDFSFFRRSLQKLKTAGKHKMTDEKANKISLFFAYPTPMMKMLTQLVREQDLGITKEEIIQGLSLLANVCLDMVEKQMFQDVETNTYCLRSMIASIILLDHLTDNGIFCRKSTVNIKNAIIILREKQDEFNTVGLINALKFTTIHLNDPETPITIKNLLV